MLITYRSWNTTSLLKKMQIFGKLIKSFQSPFDNICDPNVSTKCSLQVSFEATYVTWNIERDVTAKNCILD